MSKKLTKEQRELIELNKLISENNRLAKEQKVIAEKCLHDALKQAALVNALIRKFKKVVSNDVAINLSGFLNRHLN